MTVNTLYLAHDIHKEICNIESIITNIDQRGVKLCVSPLDFCTKYIEVTYDLKQHILQFYKDRLEKLKQEFDSL